MEPGDHQFHLFFSAVSVSVSAWSLVTISFERFVGICYPLRARCWWTKSRARNLITGVWGSSLTLLSPITITSTLQPIGNTGELPKEKYHPYHDQIHATTWMIIRLKIVNLSLILQIQFHKTHHQHSRRLLCVWMVQRWSFW